MYERKNNFSNFCAKDKQKVEKNSSAADIRKSNKPLLEKKRRARINRSLEQLKNLLIDSIRSETSSGYTKLEKADILEMTVKHLKNLQQEQMKKSADPNAIMLRYKVGYNECLQEVDRYLATMESSLNPEVRHRLLNHLSDLSRFNSIALYGKSVQLMAGGSGPLTSELAPQQWTNHAPLGNDCSDTENAYHGCYATNVDDNKSNITKTDQYKINLIDDIDHMPRKRGRYEQISHATSQPLNRSFNSSFTISSTTSPIPSPQQDNHNNHNNNNHNNHNNNNHNNQQQYSRVLKERNHQSDSKLKIAPPPPSSSSSATHYSPISSLTPSHSPDLSTTTSSPSPSRNSNDEHASSFHYEVKDEVVWRPW